VVSTVIPEAERLAPPVLLGHDREGFLRRVDEVLASGATGPRPEISAAVEGESWDAKVEQMSALVARHLDGRLRRGA
jgi:hypothetical protein